MNEPLINPWLFYASDVCEKIWFLSSFNAMAATIVLVLKYTWPYSSFEKVNLKQLLCAAVAFTMIATLTPEKKTIMNMAIASVITKENLKMTREEIITLIADIKKVIEKDENIKK